MESPTVAIHEACCLDIRLQSSFSNVRSFDEMQISDCGAATLVACSEIDRDDTCPGLSISFVSSAARLEVVQLQ